MATPRVTIGVITYNVERYLADAFDGILAQDFTDFEVVVGDNRSEDRTWEICQEYARRDPRFRIYQHESNLGVAGNLNRVIGLAEGEFFRLTAHDDLMAPTLLRRCVEVLDANPKAVLAFPQTIVIDGAGREVGLWAGDRSLTDENPSRRIQEYVRNWGLCNEEFGVIRTEALRDTRLYEPFVSSDKRVLLELALRGEFHLVPEPLFYRRVHGTSVFGEERDPDDVYGYLEPELATSGAVPKKFGKPRGDHNLLTASALKALLVNDQPLGTRLTAAATFGLVWPMRRARITLGRWRRQALGQELPLPPWEQPQER